MDDKAFEEATKNLSLAAHKRLLSSLRTELAALKEERAIHQKQEAAYGTSPSTISRLIDKVDAMQELFVVIASLHSGNEDHDKVVRKFCERGFLEIGSVVPVIEQRDCAVRKLQEAEAVIDLLLRHSHVVLFSKQKEKFYWYRDIHEEGQKKYFKTARDCLRVALFDGE